MWKIYHLVFSLGVISITLKVNIIKLQCPCKSWDYSYVIVCKDNFVLPLNP